MFFDTHTKTREWGSNKSHLIGEQMKRKARIIRYWQVVDKNNITIDNAHTHKEALEIKKEYEKTEE